MSHTQNERSTGHLLYLALACGSSTLFAGHPNKVVEDLIMNSNEALRREILRLAKAGNHAVCIRTHQLSALYNVPEPLVRRELASLAEKKLIRLSDWDGHQRRYYEHWPSAEDFVNSKSERGHCHIEMLPAQEPEKLGAAAAAGR
jgi:hypothetical protein